MSYVLKSLHEKVDDCLKFKNTKNDVEGETCRENTWQKVLEEADSFPILLIEQLAGLPNSEAVKLNFEITVAGCTALLNKLYNHHNEAQSSFSVSGTLTQLTNIVLGHLTSLRQSFPLYFPVNQLAPWIIVEHEGKKIREAIANLEQNWREEFIPEELLNIIIAPAADLYNPDTGNYTFGKLMYLHNIYSSLASTIVANKTEEHKLTTLISHLMYYNFNNAPFIRYAVKELNQKVVDSLSGEEIENWMGLEKTIAQIPECGLSLNAGHLSVKETLAAICKSEIAYCHAKEANRAAVYGNKLTVGETTNKVLTTLSVSQLALWCRLVSDCNLVQHANHTELLKTIAGALQTTRATHISPESLRVKYYTPDTAAINIVKEHLHQMLNQLKKY